MRRADWYIQSVVEFFDASHEDSIEDDEIIPRCAEAGFAWINADTKARIQHETALKLHRVSVLWVRRPNEGMTTAYQLAVLARALVMFDSRLAARPDYAQHFEIGWQLGASLKQLWSMRRT